jgi:energy-coupling factor transporter ATP-binding protein EcfA2
MKIETVHIKKFTVLQDLTHNFEGHHTLICGKNAIGKSSLIKFLRIALGETDCIPPGIDIDGEVYTNSEGKEYVFSVKMDKGKPKVTVKGPDGMSDSRKGVIATITGAMNLNIPEFIELSRTEKGRKTQVEIFKSFFPKEIIDGIDKLEAHVKTLYDERTQLSKDVKAKDLEVRTNPLNHFIDKELDKFKPVDVSATLTELKAAQQHNATGERAVIKKAQIDSDVIAAEANVEKARKALADAEGAYQAKRTDQLKGAEWLSAPENQPKPTGHLEDLINSATKTNEDYKNAQKLKVDKGLLATMVDEQEGYTIRIESSREEISKTIKDMTTDLVPGLEFNETGLIYNGIPVHPDTHSTSERIKLGLRIKIAQNQELGVLFLESLESVDEDGMKAILDIANEFDMQVIGEEVRRNTKEMVFEIIGE